MNKKENRVYVLTFPYYKTGGTELCHQLVYAINSLGGNACILYKQANDGNYLNPAFEKYVNSYEVLKEDMYTTIDGIVVIPESDTLEIPKFIKATVYLWWMSVDNYFRWQNLKYIYEETKLLRTAKYLLTSYSFKKKYLPINKMSNVKLHLAQSEYAIDFLHKNGVDNVKYLSDFINDDYINMSHSVETNKKEDIVLYNPSKGYLFTKKILARNKDINFVPLANMSNKEIVGAMSKAKVYIDFGAHPGKDRIPREAAMMGCCVLTGTRGSAAFEDVSIPNKYKFCDKSSSIPAISATILDLLENYESRIGEFEQYRTIISKEKNQFYKDVNDIFIGK